MTMAHSVLSTFQNYKEDPLPAALVVIGGAVVLKFALGVSHVWSVYGRRVVSRFPRFTGGLKEPGSGLFAHASQIAQASTQYNLPFYEIQSF